MRSGRRPPGKGGPAPPADEESGIGSWRLLGYGALTSGILLLLALSIGQLFLVSGQQILETSRSEWAQARRAATLELQRHWLFGEPEALDGFHEALEFTTRIRPPMRHALERPGDLEGLRPLLEEAFDDPAPVRVLTWFARWLGDHPRTLTILGRSIEADDLLLEVEALATEMTEAGLPGAAGDPERAFLLRGAIGRLQAIELRMEELSAEIGRAIATWSGRQQRFVRRTLLAVGAAVFLLGYLLFRGADRRVTRSEKAVRESEARLRQVTNALREVVWLTPPDKSEMLLVNPAYESIWGRPLREIYRDPGNWLAAVHPDDRDRVEAALPLQERGEYDIEYRIVTPEGIVRWIHDRAFPVRNDEGEVVRIAGVAEDITARREFEAEMLRNRSLRAVGRLAAGVAHRFNNLLTVVLGQVDLVRMDHPPGGELAQDLDAIEEAARQAQSLTRNLLAFARDQPLAPEAVDLARLLEETRELVLRILPGTLEIELDLAPGAIAHVDRSYLREILVALASMARDELPPEGVVEIRCGTHTAPEPLAVRGGELAPGRWCVLELRHDSAFLPEHLLDRLLEPFGHGIEDMDPAQGGLGLASIHGFAEQSGGGLLLTSTELAGTRLVLYLPPAEATDAPGLRASDRPGSSPRTA